MARIKPYAGTSFDRLAALISSAQTPPLPNTVHYVFSDMQGSSDPLDGSTEISVVASIGSRVDPAKVVQYERLSIDVLSLLPDGEVEAVPAIEVPFSTHQILGQINAALGIDLLPEEVVDQVFTEQSELYPLTINNNSLSWLASVFQFKMSSFDIDLAVAIPDPVLDGLVYVQP